MSVENPNSAYNEILPVWDEMDDVCSGGERKVKRETVKYLPMICSCATKEEDYKYYESYLSRAVFYPIAKNTLENNVGLAFAEDPTFNEDGLDFLKSDADGAGTSLYQQNQTALTYLLKYARGGFFVDYPQVSGGVTASDVAKGVRPTVVLYSPKHIINWRERKINGVFKTCLIVLKEEKSIVDPQDEFKEKIVKVYRVLRLDDSDQYCVQVYSDETGSITAGEVFYPTDAKGKKWDEIPFQVIGAEANSWKIQSIPIEPLASINLAHYRNSAEYEQSIFYAGQVQPVISELDDQSLQYLNAIDEEGRKINPIVLGSSSVLTLPQGATFNYVKADEGTIAKEGMEDKLKYMQLLGAKINDVNEVAKTATQSDNEQMTKHSVLSLCVSNLNEAMENVLKWVAQYYGSGYEAKFTIKQDFAKGKIGLEELKFWQSEYANQSISAETYYYIKTNGKVPEINYEEEQKRIDAEKSAII